MSFRKTYVYICLISLMLFFTGPVMFISGVFFDTFSEINVEQVDLLENESENENETPTPLEEEQHTASIKFNEYFSNQYLFSLSSIYKNQNWKSISLTTVTPPPDLG